MFILKKLVAKIISSVVGTIQVILIILRLVNAIMWPWYKVFMPLIVVVVASILFSILVNLIKSLFKRKSA